MIIEFTGVPCSGKSSVSHELFKKLSEENLSACEKQYELSHNASGFKRIFLKLAACFLYCIMHPKASISYYRIIGSLGLWLNYIHLLSLSKNNGICILEQGYLQLIGSFFDNAEPDKEKAELLFKKLMPELDIVQVFVSASRETVLKRANRRNDKPFFLTSAAPEASLELSFKTSALLKELWIENRGNEKFIEAVSTEEGSSKAVSQKIFEILKQKELL